MTENKRLFILIEKHLHKIRINRLERLGVKNTFKCLIKVAFSFCNEFVSIPNRQEAILSRVY
jgi:hypothetical protein